MGIIYIIRNNINDKVYIGQTVQSLDKRLRGHLHALNSGSKTKFYEAIREIGAKHFICSELERCDNSQLSNREIYYINKYNSYIDGYNSTPGGSANYSIFDKYREDIVNLYLSEVSSEAIAKKYNCCGETVLNILKSEGIEIRNISKEVVIKTLNKRFDTIREAARFLIQNDFTKSSNAQNVATAITRACIENKKIYGLEITCKDISQIEQGGMYTVCKQCGKRISKRTISGLCNSCSNVKAQGKIPKPTKLELKQKLNSGCSIKDIALEYDRTESTIYYWIKQYNLK